jgi:hypothetical protein
MKPPAQAALWLVVIAIATIVEAARPAEAQAPSGKDPYNACRLLTPPELDALTEKKIVMAEVVEAARERSICQWEDAAGLAFKLTVYWTGGKQGWATWRTAQGMGGATLERAEGVHPDSVIGQGVVPGVGDAAYFSPLLPSLVLKDDTLIEMELSLIPRPEKKFRKLATTLVSRLR